MSGIANNMKCTTVTIYKLTWDVNYLEYRENWYHPRVESLSYQTNTIGENAAEEAFHITNAPDDYLEEYQKLLLEEIEFKGPAVSTGDVVRVDTLPKCQAQPAEYYLCKSVGWEKYTGNVINVIKYLSW